MLTAVQGVYRRGKVELVKAPSNLREETPVLVTFLELMALICEHRALTSHKLPIFVLVWQPSSRTGQAPKWMSMTTMTSSKPAYTRGDIILVVFPDSNLRTGKLRPSLVVQADNLQTGLSQVIVAMITSKMARANHASRVAVLVSSAEGSQSGLLTDLVIMTDNLATIAHTEIGRVIGSLPMSAIDAALRYTLNL